jgi:hypothetical protein
MKQAVFLEYVSKHDGKHSNNSSLSWVIGVS